MLIDPGLRRRLSLSDLHVGSDYSIWEGWEFEGYPVTTILRGNVIVEDGKLLGSPGDGSFVERSIDTEALTRPIC